MNDEDAAMVALVDRDYDRRLEEWGGDFRLALRSAIYDWYVACRGSSSGLHRAPPVALSRFLPKTHPAALDIPDANSPEASSPLS